MCSVPIPQNSRKSKADSEQTQINENAPQASLELCDLHRLIENAYSRAVDTHGDLGLGFELFERRLVSITAFETSLAGPADLRNLESRMRLFHTNDLYLSLACLQGSEAAWECFVACYQRYIKALVRHFSLAFDPAETCDSILADLCLPARSGRARLESYDCRFSLATWLRAIVEHRLINDTKRRSFIGEFPSPITEVVDNSALEKVEAVVRQNRYAEMVHDSLRSATDSLTDREALVLLLVYDNGLTHSQVAARLGVHRSTVSHLEHRILRRLRGKFVSILEAKYHLSKPAVQECVAEALANPVYSITTLVKGRVTE